MAVFFFFNDTATTEIYTLSLHDALPISDGTCGTPVVHRCAKIAQVGRACWSSVARFVQLSRPRRWDARRDRKSTRLNSSHANISYAVFCLKKKNNPSFHHGIPSCLNLPS